jgi:hypothetical protein
VVEDGRKPLEKKMAGNIEKPYARPHSLNPGKNIIAPDAFLLFDLGIFVGFHCQ